MLTLTGPQAAMLAEHWLKFTREGDTVRLWNDAAGNLFAVGNDTGIFMVTPDGTPPEITALEIPDFEAASR